MYFKNAYIPDTVIHGYTYLYCIWIISKINSMLICTKSEVFYCLLIMIEYNEIINIIINQYISIKWIPFQI